MNVNVLALSFQVWVYSIQIQLPLLCFAEEDNFSSVHFWSHPRRSFSQLEFELCTGPKVSSNSCPVRYHVEGSALLPGSGSPEVRLSVSLIVARQWIFLKQNINQKLE